MAIRAASDPEESTDGRRRSARAEGAVTARRPSNAPDSPSWTSLLGMGVTIAALFAVGVVIGWLVDLLLDTSPIFVLAGLVLGLCAACWYCVGEFRKYLKN